MTTTTTTTVGSPISRVYLAVERGLHMDIGGVPKLPARLAKELGIGLVELVDAVAQLAAWKPGHFGGLHWFMAKHHAPAGAAGRAC